MATVTIAMRRALFLTLTAAGMLMGAPTLADGDATAAVPRISVSYDDLDLSSPAGVRTLHRRLVAAAERVCPLIGRVRLEVRTAALDCRRQALDRAIGEIGNAELAAVHAATSPRG